MKETYLPSFLPFSLDFFSQYSCKIFAEGHISGRKTNCKLEINTTIASLIKDLHGAPPGSFIVELAEAIGCLKTIKRMASFWCRVVAEVSELL